MSIDYKAFNLDELVFDILPSLNSSQPSTKLKLKTFNDNNINFLVYPLKFAYGINIRKNHLRADLNNHTELIEFFKELDKKCEIAIKECFEVDSTNTVLNYIPILKNERYLDLKLNKYARTNKIAVKIDNEYNLKNLKPNTFYNAEIEIIYAYLIDSNEINENGNKKTAGTFIVLKNLNSIC